jgi:hypothetical protein
MNEDPVIEIQGEAEANRYDKFQEVQHLSNYS